MKERSSLFKYKATESAPARPRIFSKKKKPNSISNGISGGGGGWISSKKSAKEIQQDKERARKAFDANRNRGKANKSISKADEPSKKKKSKRKNRKHDSEDDEDDDDLDDFIVHTDEEEVEQFDGAETDDEDEHNLDDDDDSIIEVTSGGKRNANILDSTKKRKRRRRLVLNQGDSDTESENDIDDERDNYAASEDEDNDDHDLDLDDEEDDDDDDVKETMSNRKRQKTTVSSHKRTLSSTASKATYDNKKKKKDLEIDLVDLNSDDDTDDEMLTTPVFQQKKAKKNSSTPKSTKSSMTVSSSSQSPTPESETEYERKESKFSSKLHSKSRNKKPQAQEEKTKTASKSSLYKHFASKSEQQTKQQDKSEKKSKNGKLSSYFQSPTKPSPEQNDSLEDTPMKPRDSLVNTTTISSSAKQQFESLGETGTGGNKKKRLIIDDSSSDDESLGYIAQDMLSQKGDSIVDSDFEQVVLESTHDNFYVSKDMLSSDDDDEKIMTSKRKKKQKARTKGKTRRNYSSSSEDEEDSDSERGRRRPSIMNIQPDKKIKKKESKVRRVIQINSDTDDEKEANDQEVDVFYVDDDSDKEEDKAKSILDATTSLSKKILNKLSLWCSADDNNSDGGDEEKKSEGEDSTKAGTPAISGMIVSDGALALNQTGALSKHPMIVPKDEIEQICQGLKLADYQLLGVNWMALLNQLEFDLDLGRFGRSSSSSKKNISHQVNGVLADEMGLGKTVQTIAFLAWLKFNQKSTRPSIIVVPASVLSNWQREFQKFCPKMKVVKYHGTLKVREEIKDELRYYLPNNPNASELDVVLTTFSYFSSEKQDDRNFLRKFKFDYLIIDEAHCLKNPQGSRYRNLNRFSTSHRLLLTGTPVQNNPSELLSLLSFMMPLFAEPDTGGQNDDFTTGGGFGSGLLQHFNIPTKTKKSTSGVDEDCYFQLKQLLAPFVLRRKKVDVLSQLLPPKKRKVEFVPFDEVSRKIYDSVLSETASNLKSLSSKNTKKAKESNKRAYANTYVKMRKAANHPLLLRTRWTEPSEIEPLAEVLYENEYYGTDASCTLKLVREQLETLSDFQIHCTALEIMEEVPSLQLSQYTLAQEDLFCSAKFARLRTLLPELISEGHRMLIFSQWTSCLDLLGCLMENLDLKYLRLDGQTKIDERQNLIDEYNTNTDIKVFLLSTRAGGMGINLTSADTCILHDLDFNPFNDLQAEDRCHRIGQTKPVTIIKMVTADTVDSLIYQMQENKTKMNVAILGKREEDSQDQLIQEIVQQALKGTKE